jgi:hypothetical protein
MLLGGRAFVPCSRLLAAGQLGRCSQDWPPHRYLQSGKVSDIGTSSCGELVIREAALARSDDFQAFLPALAGSRFAHGPRRRLPNSRQFLEVNRSETGAIILRHFAHVGCAAFALCFNSVP